jgi:hypothetical protein
MPMLERTTYSLGTLSGERRTTLDIFTTIRYVTPNSTTATRPTTRHGMLARLTSADTVSSR